MQFPVTLTFKKIALAPQITVTDASGQVIFFVKQKLLKLKEEINVFTDNTQTTQLYHIGADRIIDFSARYRFKDQNQIEFGSIKRQGARSIFKAHYDIFDDGDQLLMNIQEENGWVKVLDAVFGEIPILNLMTGYFFNPTYLISSPDGTPVMRLVKEAALFESSFTLHELVDLSEKDDIRIVLGILMMTLLERTRG